MKKQFDQSILNGIGPIVRDGPKFGAWIHRRILVYHLAGEGGSPAYVLLTKTGVHGVFTHARSFCATCIPVPMGATVDDTIARVTVTIRFLKIIRRYDACGSNRNSCIISQADGVIPRIAEVPSIRVWLSHWISGLAVQFFFRLHRPCTFGTRIRIPALPSKGDPLVIHLKSPIILAHRI
jgi:hypothetical protein